MNSGCNGIDLTAVSPSPRARTCAAGIPGTRKVVTSAYDSAVGLFDLDWGRSSCSAIMSTSPTGSWSIRRGTWPRLRRPTTRSASGTWKTAGWCGCCGATATTSKISPSWMTRPAPRSRATGGSWSGTSPPARSSELLGHEKDVLSVVSFGDRLYTSGDDMTLRVWDLTTGQVVQTWGPFETETDSCAVDPLRRRAVLGCDDGCLRIFDLDSGALVAEIEAHSSGIKKVAVSPVTGDILSAAYDQRILIWDATDLRKKLQLESTSARGNGRSTGRPTGRVLAGTFRRHGARVGCDDRPMPARGRRHRG